MCNLYSIQFTLLRFLSFNTFWPLGWLLLSAHLQRQASGWASVRVFPEGFTWGGHTFHQECRRPHLKGWGPRMGEKEKRGWAPAFASLFPDCGTMGPAASELCRLPHLPCYDGQYAQPGSQNVPFLKLLLPGIFATTLREIINATPMFFSDIFKIKLPINSFVSYANSFGIFQQLFLQNSLSCHIRYFGVQEICYVQSGPFDFPCLLSINMKFHITVHAIGDHQISFYTES